VAAIIGDPVGLRGGSLEACGPGRAEEWNQGSEIPLSVEQPLCRPMEWGLVCSAGFSFSKSWSREAFQELGVQSADVSIHPGALPQQSVSPASQQSPWFTELTQSAAMSQSPSWIIF
jgi:hypothetical protein